MNAITMMRVMGEGGGGCRVDRVEMRHSNVAMRLQIGLFAEKKEFLNLIALKKLR
jgi:hypothetical protein